MERDNSGAARTGRQPVRLGWRSCWRGEGAAAL